MGWNCVQVEHDDRIRRTIIFDQVATQPDLLSSVKGESSLDNEQDIQYGSTVYYSCEDDKMQQNGLATTEHKIKEARFVGSQQSLNLSTPREIILKLLNTDYELLEFCREHQLTANSTIESTVEAYEYIKQKLAAADAAAKEDAQVEAPPPVEETVEQATEQTAEPVQSEHVVQQAQDDTAKLDEAVEEEQHIQIQVPLQPGQVQQSSPQAIIQQPQQFLQSPRQQLFMHNQQLYAIVPSNGAGGGISQGIPLQIAKPDKQSETRAFRNGVQNIQITDGGQSYEIIQKSEEDHEETQQVVQMEETQFEERVTWGDDTGHAGTIQAQNLEVTREETIEADLDQSQSNGQQEATIAVSSSGVHQTLGAYGNQLTPTTLLLSTNHLGQTQVFPLSTIPNDPWSGQNVQQIMYPVTTVINQGDTGQIAKITSPNGQVAMQTSPTTKQSTRYTSNQVTKRTTAKRSSTSGSTRKKRTWKSLVLPPEKIPISPHGTWEKPVLERIAPGQNYKDMRTWVFYLSVHGKLFKAVVEKILHEKKTAYLTCSNAKKKALQEKCKWRGRLYMRDPLVNPDTDEFADLNNWSVVEVKNYHKHRHDNCYVEGIKHYNTQNAKRCRVQRGQVIAVHDGVVKDISKMPPEEQERILALSTQSDRPSHMSIHQMRELKRKSQQHDMQPGDQQSDQIQLVVTTLPEQQEITLEQSTMVDGQSESRLEMTEEVVEEEGIVDQQAVQRETVTNETEYELTSVDMKTEDHPTNEDDVPPLENGQEEMDEK